MPVLTERQVNIREQIIADLARMTSRSACPCCNRPFEVVTEKAEQLATQHNRAFNALVAALYPEQQGERRKENEAN